MKTLEMSTMCALAILLLVFPAYGVSSSLVFAEQVLPEESKQSVSESANLSNSTNCVQIADGPELSIQSEVSPMSPGTVTVYGWWCFAEEDELTMRLPKKAKVELWDSDLGGAIHTWLATTYTDLDGDYEFPPVDNNDGPLQGGLDVYVKIFTEGDVAWVSDVGGSVHSASTSCFSNVPDGRYNMGVWAVTGDASRAMTIYDTILLGYYYAEYSVGYSHGRVHAIWPFNRTGTDVNDPFAIYVRSAINPWPSGDEWDEDVILHEYAHSIQYSLYGGWIPNSRVLFPHDWNVTTNENCAFSEGWAWFWSVAANLEMGYGDILYPKDTRFLDHDRGYEDVDLETTPHTPGDDVEGTVAAILWDIYDWENDGRDNLQGTIVPIWDVLSNYYTPGIVPHHAYTIHDFWDGWFARNHGNTQSMWGIYFDHSIQKDSNYPSNPNSFAGDRPLQAWSNDNTIHISWSGASDDMSGVQGYSFVWDIYSNTLPDDTIDTTTADTTSTPLPDGNNWYFHIRTVDNAFNWNPNAGPHVGPFYIDTALPSNPTGWSSSHTIGGSSYDNTIDMSWWGASDSLSGVYGYSLQWTTFSDTIPDTIDDTTGTSITSPGLPYGGWYFHLRTRDNAGNWNSNALHIGPFYIEIPAGGCPYVSTWNGTTYVFDNNILPASELSNGTDVEDYYNLMQTLVPSDGKYSLVISEFESEYSYIDQIKLLAIDHDLRINIAVSPNGEILTYRTPTAPISAVDNYGSSRLREICLMDGNVEDPSTYFYGTPGDYLILNFGRVNSRNAKLILRTDMIKEKECIFIQVKDRNGAWLTVETIIPRDYWSIEGVDLSSYIIRGQDLLVRLYWKYYHRLDYVGLDTTRQDYFELHYANILSATHSTVGDVKALLMENDSIYAELAPNQQIQIDFNLPANSKETRTYILYIEGHYYTIS